MISGFTADNLEQPSCRQGEGKDSLISTTSPFFSGKDSLKNPSQKVSL